jgi:tRNA (guanine37-N1)-methyltransferase
MNPPLRIDVLSLFPAVLDAVLGESMMKRATRLGAARFFSHDLRRWADDPHRTVDDRPYGGGPGMVLKPAPLHAALTELKTPDCRVILLSPQGKTFTQARARELAAAGGHLLFICGHYEGVDERLVDLHVTEEISIGDYVLTNGILPAAVVIDAVVRLLPGVVGGPGATEQESFTTPLLDCPHYTRPEVFAGQPVPPVLLSGDHAKIARWRQEQSLARTRLRRPDLLPPTGPSAPHA